MTEKPYSPRCITVHAHECEGESTTMVGPISCCAAGAIAEQSARDASEARIAQWMNSEDGRRSMAEDAAMQRRHARRYER